MQRKNAHRLVPRSLLWGLFLIAFATLLLEVCLTRIFAVTMWYYFGFLAISLALIGTAVAAVYCFLYPERYTGDNYNHYLRKYAWMFAVSTPVAISLHLVLGSGGRYFDEFAFYAYLLLQLVPLFVAFFSAGMCITILLFRYGAQIGKVYFFDLAGAALGSLLIVPLLYWVSPLAIIFLVSALAASAELLFANQTNEKKSRLRPLFVLLVAGTLFFVNDSYGPLKIRQVKSYAEGTIQHDLPKAVYEKWSPVSRVTVAAPRESRIPGMQRMHVNADAGAPTTLYQFDGDFSKLDVFKNHVQNIPHALRTEADCLVIGSGGGRDVLIALAYDQKSVTAVEINPITVDLVRNRFADYIGNIFQDPRVSLHLAEGRNFTAGSPDLYDIITVAMIDTWGGAAAGAYIFNENSLYTREAIEDYYEHLESEGILAITRYYSWDEALRVTSLVTDFMNRQGFANIGNRIAIVLEPEKPFDSASPQPTVSSPHRYRRATIMAKKGEFTAAETATIKAKALEAGGELIHLPQNDSDEFVQTEYAGQFRALIDPAHAGFSSWQAVIDAYPRDISPPTDNRPFFFFNTRPGVIFDSNTDQHPARRLAVPMLYAIFIIFFVFSIVSIFLPLLLNKKTDIRDVPHRKRLIVYFAMLGMGFMLIEISLIQRLTVFLGHPTYSFVAVLFSLLLSCGIGSYLSGIWSPQANQKKLRLVLAAIVVLGGFQLFVVYDQFIELMALPRMTRVLLSVASVATIGILMGMCFPMGIQIARGYHNRLIPWAWGVNGAFSVFASSLSIVLALNFGLKAVFGIGLMCYMVAWMIVQRVGSNDVEDVTAEPVTTESEVMAETFAV